MSDTATTIAHARECSSCGYSGHFLRHISKDGLPLFSFCCICGAETKPEILAVSKVTDLKGRVFYTQQRKG